VCFSFVRNRREITWSAAKNTGRIPELKNIYTAATFLTMHRWEWWICTTYAEI
jgi:hypothetical protein